MFVNNLLVASDAYAKPLLRFEQPKSLCEKLPRPQATEVDFNVYVRAPAVAGRSPEGAGSAHVVEPGEERLLHGAGGVARGVPDARAVVRGARPVISTCRRSRC